MADSLADLTVSMLSELHLVERILTDAKVNDYTAGTGFRPELNSICEDARAQISRLRMRALDLQIRYSAFTSAQKEKADRG